MEIVLTTIPGAAPYVLDAPAAAALGRAITAGCPVDITNSYRSPAWQQQLYTAWLNRVPGYNFALPPAQSNHCKGIAVDVAGAMLVWMHAHGAEYGWTPDSNENWHFNYVATSDQHIPPPVETVTTVNKSGDSDVINDILWYYSNIVGRTDPPSLDEIVNAAQAVDSGVPMSHYFLGADAEGVSVTKAYHDYLPTHRDPSPAEVELYKGQTIGQMRDNVRNSPEANGH